MVESIINTKDVNDADVVLVSANYEKTASSHKGTKGGPAKIVDCLDMQVEFFDRKYKVNVNDFVKTAHVDLGDLNKLSPEKNLEKIRAHSQELIKKGKFIFLIGGEHSVSVGLFQALAEKHDPKEVTILQIDAHCDLRTDDSDYSEKPSNLAHSTVMRHASSLGFPIVQVGIRTYSKDEYEYFSDPKHKVTVFEWGNKATKEKPTVEQILDAVKTKYLYITIDVDGFDPSIMPGTGTPVQGGLGWWYGVELIEKAVNSRELVGADIVEVSPIEESVVTEYGAAQLVYTIIANKFRDKLK